MWTSPDAHGAPDANEWRGAVRAPVAALDHARGQGTPAANEWPANAWPVDNDPGSGIRPIPREPPSSSVFQGEVFRRDSFNNALAHRDSIQERWEKDSEMADYDIAETDDVDETLVPRRLTAREILRRVFGGMVFVGALYGCFTVLANPHARHEALNWVTLGHADQVAGTAHEARDRVRDLLQRR